MIVDDQLFNIQALEVFLEHVCHIDTEDICVRAFNGIQALHLMEENPCNFNLIFMDSNMPFMDGNEATMNIR